MRLQLQQTIDKNMQKHMDEERKKWKAILESVVDVILFLSKQNLPFRGHREAFESNNQGNFLETVKLLAKYSPVLSKHLSDIRISKKMTSTYLSPTIQNELILLLSKKVKNIVLEEVREAKYFAIMCDSTPDISHTDQMTLIVRYVTIKNSIALLKESFLNFFPLSGKTAAEISQCILDELELNNFRCNDV
ncbi:zinc finger MYM-type protein 1-like [Clavelina lepadiformis]|uniref:zinc finger MYM-type protein 1-like n=1 Tax=Clavelina lepadiformis TaxID=159417 RepID=UPI0040418BFC